MKLKIGPNIDENRVRLDFKSTPDKPKNTPSYIILSDKADEFVKKYNKQDKKLKAVTFIAAFSCGFGAFLTAKEHKNLVAKNKFFPAGIGVIVGGLVGALISSVVSYKMKNDLMDKYKVLPYSKN